MVKLSPQINSINAINSANKRNPKSESPKGFSGITFGAQSKLKENLKIGRDLLDEFQSTYPEIKSSSKIAQEIDMMNPRDPEILAKKAELNKLHALLEKQRAKTHNVYNSFDSHKAYIETLEACMKADHLANCGEIAEVIQFKALSRKIPAHIPKVVATYFSNANKLLKDHCYNAIGVSKYHEINNIETYGANAVGVDGWLGEVLPIKDMHELHKHELKITPLDFVSYKQYAKKGALDIIKALQQRI